MYHNNDSSGGVDSMKQRNVIGQQKPTTKVKHPTLKYKNIHLKIFEFTFMCFELVHVWLFASELWKTGKNYEKSG